MGNICSGRAPTEVVSRTFERQISILNSKKDLQINTGLFVKENLDSFYSVYKLGSAPLGAGAFAEVWLCTHRRSEEVRAVKILKKSGISAEDIENRAVFAEVEILRNLDHPNIVKVYEYFEDEQNYYIIMEYCEGGDVFDMLESGGTFTERFAAKTMKYLLSGLSYLHSRQVVHRDIKPENLLVMNRNNFDDFTIKIIDFNISTKKKESTVSGTIGTTDYMAPEVFRGLYDEKCDIWSSGVILYLLVSGFLPFQGADDDEVEKAIINGKYQFPRDAFNGVSAMCKDLISKLLMKNANARLSAQFALDHPWFKVLKDNCDSSTLTRTLTQMTTMKKSWKLKELFTTFMITQLSKNSSVKKLENVFYAIDVNRDGLISVEELINQFSKEMSLEQAEENAKNIVDAIDTDGSGQINYTEYLRATINEESLLTKENLKKAFCYFDKDGSNTIDTHELREWLSSDDIIPENVIEELMEEADANKDGTIDLIEFESFLISRLDLDEPGST